MAKNKDKKMKLPKCPHCNKGVNILAAWGYKTKGEFYCNKCHGYC